jgi:hypothetical protein
MLVKLALAHKALQAFRVFKAQQVIRVHKVTLDF